LLIRCVSVTEVSCATGKSALAVRARGSKSSFHAKLVSTVLRPDGTTRPDGLVRTASGAAGGGAAGGSLLECSNVLHAAARTKGARKAAVAHAPRTRIAHSPQRGAGATKHALFLCTKGNTMKQPNDVFNDFQARISDLFKNSPAKDVDRNVKAMLSQGFSKLDLVTREEFDTQNQVLVRTRARLEELERRVAELEQKLPLTQTP
jgi:BMFP domain-containing protein YqiC